MSTKIRVVVFEADNVDGGTMRQLMEMVSGRLSSPRVELPPPAPPPRVETAVAPAAPARLVESSGGTAAGARRRGGNGPRVERPLVCRDFPGRTFTAAEARKLCGVADNVPLGAYVQKGMKLGRKHVFEYADARAADVRQADDGGEGESGDGDDDEPPAAWPDSRLWSELKASGGGRRERIRNVLVERYMGIVERTAGQLHTRLPACVDPGDLVAPGVFGLMEAVDSFDPARGVRFATYAPRRVHGAIMDHLREYDPVPRLVRAREAKLDRCEAGFRKANGRAPEASEIAGELGLSAAEVGKLIRDGRAKRYVSMSEPAPDRDGRSCELGSLIEDARHVDPLDDLARREWWERVCLGLDRADRLILALYYREGMTMQEVADALGVSESRASQRHSALIAVLKSRMTRAAAVKPGDVQPLK